MREAWYVPYKSTHLDAKKALMLAPHPDDEVFGAGGTLALMAKQGTEIHTIVISKGENYAKRQLESIKAAQVLGYPKPEFWCFTDRELELASDELSLKITNTLYHTKPDILFAPSPWEMHPDHRTVCDTALQAARAYATETGAILTVVLYEVGLPLAVTDLIDITPVWEAKQSAMSCFKSQLSEQNYDQQITGLNIYRSYTLGKNVAAAEAFHIVDALDTTMPLPSQQDIAIHRCEEELDKYRISNQKEELAVLQSQIIKYQTECQALQSALDSVHSTRAWRTWSYIKRMLGHN